MDKSQGQVLQDTSERELGISSVVPRLGIQIRNMKMVFNIYWR